jgi:hypothetical protein
MTKARTEPPRPPRPDDAKFKEPSYGDRRREERERAYARNPDQPAAKPRAQAHDAPVLPVHLHRGQKSFGHGKPVPALLMKRKAHEPEKV